MATISVCLHLNEVTFVLFWRRTERLGSDYLNTRALHSHTGREQLRSCRVQDLTNTTKLLKNNISPRKLQQSKQNYPRPLAACTEQAGEVVQDTTCHFALFRTFWKLQSNSKYMYLIYSFYSFTQFWCHHYKIKRLQNNWNTFSHFLHGRRCIWDTEIQVRAHGHDTCYLIPSTFSHAASVLTLDRYWSRSQKPSLNCISFRSYQTSETGGSLKSFLCFGGQRLSRGGRL